MHYVGEGGGYFDASRVLWDERENGPMPEITIGGMVRVGNELVYSQDRMDEHIEAARLSVPTSCTRRQGRLALLNAGLLDDVEAAIAAIPDPAEQRAAQIEYEADTWERGNAFLQAMWAQLGGTPEELDDLFRMAVTL